MSSSCVVHSATTESVSQMCFHKLEKSEVVSKPWLPQLFGRKLWSLPFIKSFKRKSKKRHNTFESFLSTDNLKKSNSLIAAVRHASRHLLYWKQKGKESLIGIRIKMALYESLPSFGTNLIQGKTPSCWWCHHIFAFAVKCKGHHRWGCLEIRVH